MENNPRPKRNSILKVRQEKNLLEMLDETKAAAAPENATRRVSFHQMKHVKEYDRHLGKIIDATPTKEKAFDTISSDGTATPHVTRTDMDITGETTTTSRLFENAQATPTSSAHFGHHHHHQQQHDGTMDMSMDTTIENHRPIVQNEGSADETARLFDVTREKTVMYEEVTKTETQTTQTRTLISVYHERAAPDDTMALFDMTNRDEVDMSMDGGGVAGVAAARVDDTMAVFNTTNTEQIDMDITQDQKAPSVPLDDTMAVFRSPAPPRLQKASGIQKTSNENSESERVDMDITRNSSVLAPTDSDDPMDITGIQKAPEDVEPGSEAMDITMAAPNDTMDVFATPKRIQKTSGHQKTPREEDDDDDAMELETPMKVKTGSNETFDLLQSPARAKIQNPSHQILVVEEEEEHVDMDITQREAVEPSDDTMAVFRSPAKTSHETTRQVFDNESMDIESTLRPEDVVPEESPEDVKRSDSHTMMSMATETSIVVVEENRCVSTMLQMSPIGRSEDVEIQKMSTTTTTMASDSQMSLSSSIHNSSVTLNVSKTGDVGEEDGGASERSQIQTMVQEDADVTNPLQNLTTKEEETEADSEDVTMKEESRISAMNVSSVSRRRRSLLMDPLCRESPRRLALGNSMLSMSTAAATTLQGGGGALAEYRHSKRMLNESVGSVGSAGGNQTLANLTATGRDIFQLNTSVRSPAHRPIVTHHHHLPNTTVTSPDATLQQQQHVVPPKSPESFRLPQFDAAIVNVIYLTPEDDAQEPIPEAFEFQKLLAQQEAYAHREIEEAVNGDETLQKVVDEIGGDVVKIRGHLERDVIRIAIGQAEKKFLELRGEFAEEHVAKSDALVVELEAENARLAQRVQDARNVETLRAELHELQRRPTREEARRIRREHHEAKMESMRMQLASTRARYEAEMEMRAQRQRVEDALEEKREQIARLEDAREKIKTEMAGRVRAIVPEE